MAIKYFEEDGKLCFACEEKIPIPTKVHAGAWRIYEFSGSIPQKILKKGEQAIKDYAEREWEASIRKKKEETEKEDQFAKDPDFPISIEYRGKTLEGRIISADDSTLRVRLEKPYQGEGYRIFGSVSARDDEYIFDGKGSFSEDAIVSAKILLVRIYQKKKHYEEHKKIIDLTEQLNSSQQ